MDEFPKRRKSKDNPYHLSYNKDLGKYQVTFIDSKRNLQVIEISKEVYSAFNEFELQDLSFMNEFDRHIEHLEQIDEMLYNRAAHKETSVEDEVMYKIEYQSILDAIETLPKIQKIRIKKYFLEEKTLKQIAEEEHCSIRAIKYSIDIAVEKLKKQKF